MDAQLAFLDSECTPYDRKRPQKEAEEEKETTHKKSSKGAVPSELKRACYINHMAIAKKFPKPPRTSWNKWKVQIRTKYRKQGLDALNPREARILLKLQRLNRKSNLKKVKRRRDRLKELNKAKEYVEAAESAIEKVRDDVTVQKRLTELQAQVKKLEVERDLYAHWIIYKRFTPQRWKEMKEEHLSDKKYKFDYPKQPLIEALMKWDKLYIAKKTISETQTTDLKKIREQAIKKVEDDLKVRTETTDKHTNNT